MSLKPQWPSAIEHRYLVTHTRCVQCVSVVFSVHDGSTAARSICSTASQKGQHIYPCLFDHVISSHESVSSVFIFHLRNDLYCVGWGVKLYSLTHHQYFCLISSNFQAQFLIVALQLTLFSSTDLLCLTQLPSLTAMSFFDTRSLL